MSDFAPYAAALLAELAALARRYRLKDLAMLIEIAAQQAAIDSEAA